MIGTDDARALPCALLALLLLGGVACGVPGATANPGGDFSDADLAKAAVCNTRPGNDWRELRGAMEVPTGGALAAYRVGVERQANHWESHRGVAAAHLERGEVEAAAEIFLRYPPFRDERLSRDPSLDAERAAAAGAEVLWRGDAEGAAPLFEAVARLTPWSAAALAAGFQLAVLREDWTTAAEVASLRLRRCEGSDAVRDWILIESLLGRRARAWALFELGVSASVESGYDSAPWVGAFVAQRIAGRSDAEIVAWLSDPATPFHLWSIQEQGGLQLMTDRAVSEGWSSELEALHLGMWRREHARISDEQIRESAVESSEGPRLLAEAYASWRHGRYDEAWQTYRRATRTNHGPGIAIPPEILPYLAWSAIEAGQIDSFERYLEETEAQRRRWAQSNPTAQRRRHHTAALTAAVRSGLAGNHASARARLREALQAGVRGDGVWMLASQQRLELAVALLVATDDDGYREVALELARRQVRIEPWFAWSWAAIARYAPDEVERRGALRRALFLDRRSVLLDGVAPEDLVSAQRWLDDTRSFAM